MVGFTWRRHQPEPRIEISSRRHGHWSEWTRVPTLADLPDEDDAEWAGRAGTQLLWIGPADGIQIRVAHDRPKGLTMVLLHPARLPGDAQTSLTSGPLLRTDGEAVVPDRPQMLGRKVWGADESWRNGGPRYNHTIEQVHVHHTANSNDYTESDVPALLRGIYRYHTKSLGWSDIAYNFLVDRFGRTWVGRAGGAALPVRGAHTLGFNATSTGIAALGNYETTEPSPETLTAIVRLAAWKLGLYARDPEGTVSVTSEGSDKFRAATVVELPVIDGHRDTNDTACPGQHLYDQLPAIRRRTARHMQPDPPPAITITAPFELTGDTVVGAELTATSGTYTPADATVTYTWLRDGLPIADAAQTATRTTTLEDVGHLLGVRVDLTQTGYTGASQTLTTPSPVQAQAALLARARPRHGNVRVDVTVSAPGLLGAPTGEVVIKLQGRPPRTVVLADGSAVARFINVGRGAHRIKVTYAGADLVRGTAQVLMVRVNH
jgi:hypothetical protein